jgi:predicted esterase
VIRRLVTACVIAFFLAACAPAEKNTGATAADVSGNIMKDVPEQIRPERHYLFYLHGQIIEDQGVRPEHPEFGVYEYEGVLDALAAEGFEVISEPRPPRTDGQAYAGRVVTQIEKLLSAGVPAERIAVVGFSKGGGIAVAVASMLGNERVRFVFLGTCATRIRNRPQLELRGRVLSIYEASDPVAGSCEGMFSESVIVPEFQELEVRLGGGHGAFYRPAREWIDPVVAWVRGETD